MAIYRLSDEALAVRLKRATLRLRAKYSVLTLLVIGLGVLNYERNDQRHWQTEVVALVLCAILLVAGYVSGRGVILAAQRSPLDFYSLTIGVDCIECKDSLHGDIVLHVSEIASTHAGAHGLSLRATTKERCVLVPKDLQDYSACVAELKQIGVPV